MRKYFIFMLFSMLSFTGYILVKRPGTSLSMTIPKIGKSKRRSRSVKKPPYFVYLSGDVLVTDKNSTYSARNKIRLVNGDEIFVGPQSMAIILLDQDQLILLEEGSKLQISDIPKRKKGLTQFFLKRGEVLVDFWQGDNPMGIKLSFTQGYVFGQDTTFRIKVTDEQTFVANDRSSLLLYHKESKKESSIEEAKGALFTNSQFKTGQYSWVDDYPWEQSIEMLSYRGIGKKQKLNAPGLDTRSFKVKRRKRKRAISQQAENKAKAVLDKLKDGASGLTSISDKIKASQQALKEFKKKQQQNKKVLDSL